MKNSINIGSNVVLLKYEKYGTLSMYLWHMKKWSKIKMLIERGRKKKRGRKRERERERERDDLRYESSFRMHTQYPKPGHTMRRCNL